LRDDAAIPSAERQATMDEELIRYRELDAELVALVKDIKMLSTLSWPKRVQDRFLADWRAGRHQLPQIEYRKFNFAERRHALKNIAHQCDAAHPIGNYLQRTAHSWQVATLLLDHLGSREMTEYSAHLYGRPGDRIAGSAVNNLEAAQHFISAADDVLGNDQLGEPDYCLSAEIIKVELESKLDEVFFNHKVRVEVDPDLVAKAAAGPTRIRLRAGTCFSEYDLSQLLEHEAFVHSLTSLNGRAQRNLGSLGLNSPRITATQEGLAVFSELVTGSIDIMRMKRISLRILAIDMALRGANFIEVFSFFLEQGQSETESFTSAMRVFRGAPTEGGSAFTKDTVYLHGLLSVHTFFRWALRSGKLELAQHLFAGKMTLQDVVELEPYVKEGFIDPPQYLPPWMHRKNGLAGYLSFSLFVNRIRLDQVEREHVLMGV
jgi:uncharacterized protein (TIGR02421 family)